MEVEVPMSTCCPPLIVKPEPTVRLPKVVVPMPPLPVASKPLTSFDPKLMAALNRAPAEVERTGKAWVKDEMVVEPLVLTEKMEVLAPFLMSNTAKLEADEEVAWIITGMVVEAMLKLWIWSKATGEVVPKPTLVPLSNRKELAVVELAVYLTKKLAVPLPESLLLKVNQSAAWSWPVLLMEEKGRLRVKVVPEIEPLKMLPEVPVAKLVTGLPPNRVEVEVQVGWPAPLLIRKLPATPAWLNLKVVPSL